MKLTKKDNYIIVTDDKNNVKGFSNFLENHAYDQIKDEHLVVDLLKYGKLQLEELLSFLNLSIKMRKNKRSFVIVNDAIVIDDVPDELAVVPTLREAGDVIKMEDLEREMGVF